MYLVVKSTAIILIIAVCSYLFLYFRLHIKQVILIKQVFFWWLEKVCFSHLP